MHYSLYFQYLVHFRKNKKIDIFLKKSTDEAQNFRIEKNKLQGVVEE